MDFWSARKLGKILERTRRTSVSRGGESVVRGVEYSFGFDWFFSRGGKLRKRGRKIVENRTKRVFFVTDSSFVSSRASIVCQGFSILAFLLGFLGILLRSRRGKHVFLLLRYWNKVARREMKRKAEQWIKRLNKNYRFIFVYVRSAKRVEFAEC